jgi:hypothetical protein
MHAYSDQHYRFTASAACCTIRSTVRGSGALSCCAVVATALTLITLALADDTMFGALPVERSAISLH